MKKEIKSRGLIALFVAMLTLPCLTACDPDDIDAFADGYRQGWDWATKAQVETPAVVETPENINE